MNLRAGIVFCKMPPCWVTSMVSPPTFRFDNFPQYDMIPRDHQTGTPHLIHRAKYAPDLGLHTWFTGSMPTARALSYTKDDNWRV